MLEVHGDTMIFITQQPPIWVTRFLGIPYLDMGRDKIGCDCWGLVRLVMLEQAGIALSSYETVSESDYATVSLEMKEAKNSSEWLSVTLSEQKSLDVVEMSSPVKHDRTIVFIPVHVGVLVSPFWVLHTEKATGSRLSSTKDDRIAGRILGYWRHRSLQ